MDVKPQLAENGHEVIVGADFVVEPKFDGTRILAYIAEEGVHFYTRRGEDHIGKLSKLTKELSRLPNGTWLDGELVDMTLENGEVSFEWGTVTSVLGSKLSHLKADSLQYIAFDIMQFNGTDCRSLPLSGRRELLDDLMAKFEWEKVLVAPQLPARQDAHELFTKMGYEGTMVKNNTAPYASGKRGHGWTKIKDTIDIEAIIVGYQEGKNSFKGMVGAVLFGQFKDGELVERGKCSGMDFATRQHMTQNPKDYLGRVITVRHEGLTDGGRFRFPRFVCLRDDKNPNEVQWHDE